MDSERFDLVFSGELTRGAELSKAKINLGQLFKISESKVDALFSGKPIVLKKGLDFAAANKYRAAIKKAGCRVDLVEQIEHAAKGVRSDLDSEMNQPMVSRQPKVEVAAPEPTADPEPKSTSSENSLPLVQVDEAPFSEESTSVSDDSRLTLAPAGSPVLVGAEKETIAPVHVDTSQFSLRELGESLLEDSEKSDLSERLEIELDLDLAPLGAELLEASEKKKVVANNVDTSALTLGEPGSDLGQLKEEIKPQAPDVSHLSVE